MHLSIIVPLAPNEGLDPKLSADVKALAAQSAFKDKTELILSSLCEKTLAEVRESLDGLDVPVKTIQAFKTLPSDNGRATCLNAGAAAANGKWLFFCHADSHFERDFHVPIIDCMRREASGIFYFNLRFSDGSPLMHINEWGVSFRCHFLKTPFGDQGLLMTKQLFDDLGKYVLTAPYGEDHLLIRHAKAHNVPIVSLGKTIFTSARKYSAQGWFKTTMNHQWLWYLQIYSDRRERWRA